MGSRRKSSQSFVAGEDLRDSRSGAVHNSCNCLQSERFDF